LEIDEEKRLVILEYLTVGGTVVVSSNLPSSFDSEEEGEEAELELEGRLVADGFFDRRFLMRLKASSASLLSFSSEPTEVVDVEAEDEDVATGAEVGDREDEGKRVVVVAVGEALDEAVGCINFCCLKRSLKEANRS